MVNEYPPEVSDEDLLRYFYQGRNVRRLKRLLKGADEEKNAIMDMPNEEFEEMMGHSKKVRCLKDAQTILDRVYPYLEQLFSEYTEAQLEKPSVRLHRTKKDRRIKVMGWIYTASPTVVHLAQDAQHIIQSSAAHEIVHSLDMQFRRAEAKNRKAGLEEVVAQEEKKEEEKEKNRPALPHQDISLAVRLGLAGAVATGLLYHVGMTIASSVFHSGNYSFTDAKSVLTAGIVGIAAGTIAVVTPLALEWLTRSNKKSMLYCGNPIRDEGYAEILAEECVRSLGDDGSEEGRAMSCAERGYLSLRNKGHLKDALDYLETWKSCGMMTSLPFFDMQDRMKYSVGYAVMLLLKEDNDGVIESPEVMYHHAKEKGLIPSGE